MRTIVTGGAGFIGSHLIDRLLKDGHRVTVLDNFSTGRPENLIQHEGNKRLKVVKCDISLPFVIPAKATSDVAKAGFHIINKDWIPDQVGDDNFKYRNFQTFEKLFTGVDWLFHLAALADIVPSIVNPLDYHHSNVDGTVNILEASRMAKVKRFIYAASSSCYGIPDQYPTPETADIRTQYPYALTKFIGEQYVLHWGKIYKLPVVSLRFFNVYGPRSRTSGTYGAVFGTFLAQKLAGKPYTVVGDGKQTRDFTFVSDVVEAIMLAAKSDVINEIFNVGMGSTYSVNKLVGLLGSGLPAGQQVTYIPKRPGEPDCTQADISKIKKELGWKPKISLEKGVKILLENIDYWKKAPVWTPQSIKSATKDWFKYLS